MRDKSKEPDTYWAGDNAGATCSVPGCMKPSNITKHNKQDKKVRLCFVHRDLKPDVIKQEGLRWTS